MPCTCANCTSGVKGGAATKVAICDLNLVECGAQIPGLGPVTGQIEAAPASIASPSAQDITDFSAETWTGGNCTFVDAYTTWSTDRDNILLDNGLVWPIGDATNYDEGLFRVDFDNPFAVCPEATINLIDFLLVYEAIVTAADGVVFPGVWVAWRKADNSLVQLVDLGGTNDHGVPVRVYVPATGVITVDDLANGYGLIGVNLANTCSGSFDNSRIDFDYIGARFTYDATVCYDPSDPASGGTRALPVSIVCNSTDANPVAPIPTLDWEMQSGTATVPAAGSVVVNTNPNMHVMSVYNPGANSITVDFTNSSGGTSQQIIPPSSNYTFGVGDVYLAFGTAFTFSNAGGSNIDIIWNVSTTGE